MELNDWRHCFGPKPQQFLPHNLALVERRQKRTARHKREKNEREGSLPYQKRFTDSPGVRLRLLGLQPLGLVYLAIFGVRRMSYAGCAQSPIFYFFLFSQAP